MANLATNVPLVNEAFVDPKTGRVTEAWFLFLIQLWRRTGGTTPSNGNLTLADILSLEETFAQPSIPFGNEIFSREAVFADPDSSDSLTETIVAPFVSPDSLSEMTFAQPSSTSGGAGSITDKTFSSGTDFTGGVTTTLTLSNSFANGQQLWIFFDGTFQGDDQYSLSGTTITFTSAIPVGVNKVYVKGIK